MRWLPALAVIVATSAAGAAERFDVVIRGGRVMDPETGRDGVFDVGLVGDRIARISAAPLEAPASSMPAASWSRRASSICTSTPSARRTTS